MKLIDKSKEEKFKGHGTFIWRYRISNIFSNRNSRKIFSEMQNTENQHWKMQKERSQGQLGTKVGE